MDIFTYFRYKNIISLMKILNEKLQFPFDPKNEDYVILLKALMEKDPHKRPKDINEILNYSYLK